MRIRKSAGLIGLTAFAIMIALPSSVYAMHISEGILPPAWAGLWFVVSLPFIAWGLRDLRERSRVRYLLHADPGAGGGNVFASLRDRPGRHFYRSGADSRDRERGLAAA